MEAVFPQSLPKESFAFYEAIGGRALLRGRTARSRYLN